MGGKGIKRMKDLLLRGHAVVKNIYNLKFRVVAAIGTFQ